MAVQPTPKSSDIIARLFCILFGLPFFGGGLCALAAAAGLLRAQPNSKILLVLLGSVFALIGGAFIYAGLCSPKLEEKGNELKTKHPDEPWKWKHEWQSGVIKCSSKGRAIGLVLFAFIWNAVSSPILFQFQAELNKGNKAVWVGLLFPLVGVGLILAAIRAIIHYRKFGVSTCTIGGGTGVIGGELRATLQCNNGFPSTGAAEITLECIHKTTSGSGKNRSTHSTVLWQEKKTLPKHSYSFKSGLNLNFTIPAECSASSTEGSKSWRLSLRVPTDGLDYEAHFDVPVFRTAASSDNINTESISREPSTTSAADKQDYDTAVTTSNISGGKQFYFPAGRHKWVGLFLFLFLVAIGVGAYFATTKLSIFFGIVLVLIDLLFLIIFLCSFCQSSKVIAKPGSLKIISSVLGIKSERNLSATEIDKVALKIGMQSHSANRTTVYYDILIHTSAGKRRQIAASLKSKQQAEQIAAEIENIVLNK